MSDIDTGTTLTNLVVLGRAAPEEMNDGRQTVCTGAWSPDRGFIRLYPIDPQANLFSRWDVIDAEVKRNPKDSRPESWKIKGRKQNQREKVKIKGKYPRGKRATLLHNLEDDCVNTINDARRSLGIIKPEHIEDLLFEKWSDDDAGHVQAKLFEQLEEDKPNNRDEFEFNIKVQYTCPDCQTDQGYHKQTLLEWGAYMGLKNNPNNPDQLRDNYRLRNDEFDHWLFVGNLNQHKGSFIVISLISVKKDVKINTTLQPFRKTSPDFEPINN